MTRLSGLAAENGVETPVFPGHGAISRAYTYVEGGRGRYLEYLAHAVADGNDVATRWWRVFEVLRPYEQVDVAFEDVCVAAGVPSSELLGVIVAAAARHGADASDIAASTMLPSVVRQLAKSALRIGGDHAVIAQKDRTLLLQSRKFAPVPRNATINVTANANAISKAAAASASQPSVPSFMEDMHSLVGSKEHVQRAIAGTVDVEAED